MNQSNLNQHTSNFAVYYLSGIFTLTALGLVLRFLFYIYNQAAFSTLSHQQLIDALLNGLTFDVAVASLGLLLLIIPFWLASRLGASLTFYKICIYLIAGLLVLTQTSDTLYFSDAGRHVSYEIKDAFVDANSLILMALLQHGWFILSSVIVAILSTIGLFKLSTVFLHFALSKIVSKLPRLLRYELLLSLFLLLSIIFARGGLAGIPQEPLSAFKSGSTSQGQITLNGAYSVSHRLLGEIEEVNKINIPAPTNLTEHQLKNRIVPFDRQSIAEEYREFNVVMVFLESWQAAQMKSYGGQDDVTPYFDSLREQSISPNYVYAGGYRTTEGLFSTLCSFQNPLGKTVAQSQLQSFDYLCLPHILKAKGWETAFFQGSNKDTSGTGIFAQRLGFTNSYGKADILNPKLKFNSWGAQDPDLYKFVNDKVPSLKEPFFIGINTTSTHDDVLPSPFTPLFGMDNQEQRYKSVLNFADKSLQQFITQFQSIKREKKTIFVLISDHTAGIFLNKMTRVLIPGIIFSPELNIRSKIDRAVHQRDFSPTLLSLLNIQLPASFAGQSMLKPRSSIWDAEFYNSGHLSVVKDNALVNFNILSKNKSCFDINYPKLNYSPSTCTLEDDLIINSALGFSQYSQNLLFSGKTTEFNHAQ